MAVQQNKKSPSKRGMHRAHDFLTNPPTAVEPPTAFEAAQDPAVVAAKAVVRAVGGVVSAAPAAHSSARC